MTEISLNAQTMKKAFELSFKGFLIWLLDLGSNQGPTD